MKKIIGTVVGMVLTVSGLMAQPRRMVLDPSDRIDLAGSVRFSSQGQEYELLPHAAAIRAATLGGRLLPGINGATPADLRAAGLQAVRVHMNRGPMIVYERSAAGGLALSVVAGMTNYPVVRKVSTGQTGFLSGQIRAGLHAGADPHAVAQAAGLTVYASFPEIQTAFLQVPSGRDLAQASAAVAGDPRIRAADIEVIEQLNRPL
jgi:hypothetical protein